jgi:transcriptional regulator with XRE-family HTH domain
MLRTARRKAGLTQAELAARAGVSQSVVARAEAPGSNPRVATLDRLLRAAGRRLATAPASPLDDGQLRERMAMSPGERLRTFRESQANLAGLAARARRVKP